MAACTPALEQHGNLPDPDRLAQIKPGAQSRDDVAKLLGTPSSVGVFDGETWYYIASRTESFAFYDPKVLDRQVVAIDFDQRGVVKGVRRYGLKDGRKVAIIDRVTPTGGRKLTFLEQILGNFGRFNKGANAPTGRRGRGGKRR